MCGLAGVIFGEKRRRAEEREYLAWLFTRLLVLSEERGPHATGAAWLKIDGGHRLFKRPVTPELFVTDKAFAELLAYMDNATTLLLGHTRWRTRGDERVNSNNHPIRAGEVIGTHNGTIYNADYLFRRWKMRRFAEVDSEMMFRLAERFAPEGPMDIERSEEARLRLCRGQITAVHRLPDRSGNRHCAQGEQAVGTALASTASTGWCSTLRTPHTSTPCWRRKKAGGSFRSRP